MLERGVSDVYRRFVVVVHDVAPVFLPQLARIAEALAPRVGRCVAGAVVPCWHGRAIEGPGGGFGRFVTGAFGEILQHGYTHRQDRPGVLSLFTGRSDELAGLSREEVRRRLRLGRELLRRALRVAPAGFVPPAWQAGEATTAELAGCGFRYLATFGAIRAASGPTTIPLATWSWDWGVLGPLGRVGQRFGDVCWRLRPATCPASWCTRPTWTGAICRTCWRWSSGCWGEAGHPACSRSSCHDGSADGHRDAAPDATGCPPRISVVIPARNEAALIASTVGSVLRARDRYCETAQRRGGGGGHRGRQRERRWHGPCPGRAYRPKRRALGDVQSPRRGQGAERRGEAGERAGAGLPRRRHPAAAGGARPDRGAGRRARI